MKMCLYWFAKLYYQAPWKSWRALKEEKVASDERMRDLMIETMELRKLIPKKLEWILRMKEIKQKPCDFQNYFFWFLIYFEIFSFFSFFCQNFEKKSSKTARLFLLLTLFSSFFFIFLHFSSFFFILSSFFFFSGKKIDLIQKYVKFWFSNFILKIAWFLLLA